MSIKINDVAVVKITGEEVWVLNFIPIFVPASAELIGTPPPTNVSVRRPTQTNDGVKHLVETFTLDELESLEDAASRRRSRRKQEQTETLAEQTELQQKIMQLKPSTYRYPSTEVPDFDHMQ